MLSNNLQHIHDNVVHHLDIYVIFEMDQLSHVMVSNLSQLHHKDNVIILFNDTLSKLST